MIATLANRSALITGGLTGQGFAIASALAQAGANVAVGSYVGEAQGRLGDAAAYPELTEIERVREALAKFGTKVVAGHLDVRNITTISHFFTQFYMHFTHVDILINAAGTTVEQPVCGHTDELWDKILDTNLNGAFRMTREVLPGMIARRWGRIVNIGSTAASVGWKDNPAYCASKAGLLGLTRCVALEGAPHGVTCNMVSPTWVETELMQRNISQLIAREGKGRTLAAAMAEIAAQNPQNRLIQPDEIAAAVAFLCSDAAKGITGENLQITGGALW